MSHCPRPTGTNAKPARSRGYNPDPPSTPIATHAGEQRKYRGQAAQKPDTFWESTYDD